MDSQKIPETIGVNYKMKIFVVKYLDKDSDTLRYRKYHLQREIERIRGLMDEIDQNDNEKLCDLLMQTLTKKDELIGKVDEEYILRLVRNLLDYKTPTKSMSKKPKKQKKKKKRRKKKKKMKGIKKIRKIEQPSSSEGKKTPVESKKTEKDEFKPKMSDLFNEEEKEFLQKEDLNLLSTKELDDVKDLMDSDFLMKQVIKGDDDYEYEKNVDFGDQKEDSGWD